MISLISTTEDGEAVEVASNGREGMVGLPILLPSAHAPYAVHVRLPTEVLRVRASTLRTEVKAVPALNELLVAYLHELVHSISQTAV
jgi:hypothetical protein